MDLPKEDSKGNQPVNGLFFLRQLFSCSAVVMNFFIFGLYLGATTVIVPQLRRESNSTDAVTPEMASWLSSISSYCAIPWGFVLPLLAYRYGRKPLLVLVSVNVLLANIIFYNSTNIIELIVSQATLGILVASVMTVTVMVMSEYTSPKYRGIILTIKAATFYWGVWVSNVIGTFYHWRNIGIVIFVCGVYNLSSIFCYESPYWLATKGRYEECAKAHRWLKGTDEESEDELRKLISMQHEHLSIKTELNGYSKVRKHIKLFNILKHKRFYMPFLYASLPMFLYNLSGKIVCTVYAIDIIKNITFSEKMAFEGMLILDAVTVSGMYFGCVLSKYLTRRVQLLVLSSAAICFLYILSISLYMIKLNIITENNYVSLVLLMGFSLSISCGPLVIASCCSAELSPLRYRSYFVCCLALLDNMLFATILKVSPLIFKHFGTHGAFMFYAAAATIFVCLLYKYLPETKDKTIQEIQEHIIGILHTTAEIEIIPIKELESYIELK